MNRTAKKVGDTSKKYQMYRIKNDTILEAVRIIEETKTQAIKYTIDFDEEKNMHYITFLFKKAPYIKYEKLCFHLTTEVHSKITSLKK